MAAVHHIGFLKVETFNDSGV